jgi:hypothetical protein
VVNSAGQRVVSSEGRQALARLSLVSGAYSSDSSINRCSFYFLTLFIDPYHLTLIILMRH